MIKFQLFIKSQKFHWSTNSIIYAILFSLLFLWLLIDKVFNLEKSILSKTLAWMCVITFSVGVILKFLNMGRVKPLHGELIGFIFFDDNSILINDREIFLSDLKKIYITNDDYYGKLVEISRGNFGPSLSNGTNNFVELVFLDNSREKYQYELVNQYDFFNIKSSLIKYHLAGKIDFEDLASLIYAKSSREKKYLKEEIYG